MILRTFLSLLLFLSLSAHADIPSRAHYSQEREVYQQALKALKQNDLAFFKQSRRLLADYPLAHYLDYEELLSRFDETPKRRVKVFLRRHEGSFLAKRLQYKWLNHLAQNEQWKLFKEFYEPNLRTDRNACFDLIADLALGVGEKTVFENTSKVWVTGRSLPNNCNSLFKQWEKAGYKTAEMRWQRFKNAYAANNISFAKTLSRKLVTPYKQYAKELLQTEKFAKVWLKRLEANSLADGKLALDSAASKRLLTRLNRTHHQQVAQYEHRKLPLEDKHRLDIKRLTAWYIAKENPSEAQQWISQQSANHPDLTESRLRFVLQAKDWGRFIEIYQSSAEKIQQSNEWLYWYAQALQQLPQKQTSAEQLDTIYQKLANSNGFYGLLAAEKIGKKELNIDESLANTQVRKATIKQLSAALELYYMDERNTANREWYYASRHFDAKQWQEAGIIAHHANWYERSIEAVAKAKRWNAVDYRFPLAYSRHFSKHAKKLSLSEPWLMAMARQESAFSANAISGVGARGVLQLMPATAKRVAKRMRVSYRSKNLYDPAYNISLGSRYLKEMLDKFDNDYVLATAAYNAGPHRVNEWLSLRPMTKDWVHWVATIPYKETRKYVQNILAYSQIYRSRLKLRVAGVGEFNKNAF